jgi:CRP-like cAMP-binding protein
MSTKKPLEFKSGESSYLPIQPVTSLTKEQRESVSVPKEELDITGLCQYISKFPVSQPFFEWKYNAEKSLLDEIQRFKIGGQPILHRPMERRRSVFEPFETKAPVKKQPPEQPKKVKRKKKIVLQKSTSLLKQEGLAEMDKHKEFIVPKVRLNPDQQDYVDIKNLETLVNKMPNLLDQDTVFYLQVYAKYKHKFKDIDKPSKKGNETNRASFHNIDYNYARECLLKPPHTRNHDDIKILYHTLKSLPAFAKLSNFILEQLCGVLHFVTYEADRVIFLQGDVGTSWYVILKGSTSVSVLKNGENVLVKVLTAGEGFGDLALINDKPRAATIMTREYTELVRIEKDDYNRTLRFMYDRETKQKVAQLRRIKNFESWNEEGLKNIAGFFQVKRYQKGVAIIDENGVADQLFILYSGRCTGYRRVFLPSGFQESSTSHIGEYIEEHKRVKKVVKSNIPQPPEMRVVKVHEFDLYDYFGER